MKVIIPKKIKNPVLIDADLLEHLLNCLVNALYIDGLKKEDQAELRRIAVKAHDEARESLQ